MSDATMCSVHPIEIVRQLLYTRDIQTTSKPRKICGHLRSGYAGRGGLIRGS